MTVLVRPAGEDDVGEICALLRTVVPRTYPYLEPLGEWVDRYADPARWKVTLQRADAQVLVASAGLSLAGVATLTMPTDDSWWEGDLYLGSVYVREPGHGLGSRLVERALSVAPRFGTSHLRADVSSRNTGARRFLERHGFTAAGDAIGWLGVTWVPLRRQLSG